MQRTPLVRQATSHWRLEEYDAIFCCIGYEERARFIASQYEGSSLKKFALGFTVQQELEFEANQKFFVDNNFEVLIVDDNEFSPRVAELLSSIVELGDDQVARILVDISSLSRSRIATFVDLFSREYSAYNIKADFLYALATYTPPVMTLAPNSHVGPVLNSNFAGGWDEPDRAISTIVGLGYEPDKALGAVEYLEAADIWTFTPESTEVEYTDALRIANEHLLEGVPPGHQFTYFVHDPLDCFLMLESVVSGVMQTRNAVLLPFGPKLFALCCLLVACFHPVAVWRVSAQSAELPVNRKAKGEIYGLQLVFAARTGG